jgi:predicted GIY-YIG superfamily endonuclease
MYYVYVLYFDEMPIYAGATCDPIGRYKAHYFDWDSCVRNLSRYQLVHNNKFVKMKLVYCNEEKHKVWNMEYKAIIALIRAGFATLNKNAQWHRCWPKPEAPIIHDPPIPIFPEVERLPQKLFTFEAIKHIIDSKNEILKQYGYEEHRHYNMDHSKSISRPIRDCRSKRTQLGKKK